MIGKDIQKAAALLQAGKLVAIPTETVYGLAGNAFYPTAVAAIFAAKNRPNFDPLIVHTYHLDQLTQFVQFLPDAAQKLAHAFMPGPLTLLLPKKEVISDLVTAGSSIVAVRVPNHPLSLELLAQLDFPVAAPSANPFGYISPTTAQHVAHQLGQEVPYILDGGPCNVGLESTIVGFPEGKPTIYRKGGVSLEAIEATIGSVEVRLHSSSNPQAPGMLKSHYAPKAPLVLGEIPSLLKKFQNKKIGIISFWRTYNIVPEEQQVVLSSSKNYKEAAQNLFAGMRLLDNLNLDVILAELLPEEDLGRAINDRLRRAAV